MQTSTHKKKEKYVMQDYTSLNHANPMIQAFSKQKDISIVTCLCIPKIESQGLKCFKCNTLVHFCLASKPNRGELYQCFSCINKSLDPLVQVRKVLVQSYFKTFPIFQYRNVVKFQFYLLQQDLGFPVEIRGLIPNNTSLSWPMQGAFYMNDENNSVHELKPLLFNSNRKHRREQYFHIGSDKLKAGRNVMIFKIPCLDRAKFTSKFQHQDKKIYYMAVNSVQRLTPADLQTQTFRQRRIQKPQSIKILTTNNAEIQVISNKVCLICPYTRERIRVPVRGRYCKHFSCICLQTLIASHSQSRYWGCPICELKINQPYVDVWIYNMLKDNQRGSDVTVKEDGTYEWVSVPQNVVEDLDESSNTPPQKPKEANQMVAQPKQKIQLQVPIPVNKDTSKQINEANIISLDDDDEDLLKQKQKQSRKQALVKRLKQKSKETQLIKTAKSLQPKQSKYPVDQGNKKQDRPIIQKPRLPSIPDIRSLQTRQLKFQQFKKHYFKPRTNPYKKMIQTQEFKRLFKQVY